MQLRLAAALEADAELLPELDDLLHHVALLVHLDRVDRGVAPFIAELLDRVGEVPREGRDARPQDVGEAEEERQAHALRIEIGGELVQVEPTLGIAIGMDGDMAFGVHPEVAETPAAHVVELLGVLRRPDRGGNGGGDRRLLWCGVSMLPTERKVKRSRRRTIPIAVARERGNPRPCCGVPGPCPTA